MASKPTDSQGYQKRWLILASLFILILITGGLYLTRSNPHARQASQMIDQLYADDEKVYLDAGISLEDIERTQGEVDQVKGRRRKALQTQLDDVKEKYDGIRALSEIYDVTGPLILSKEAAEDLPLAAGVSVKDIEEKDLTSEFQNQDELVEKMSALFDSAKTKAQIVEEAPELLKQLQEVEIKDEASIEQLVQLSEALGQKLAPIKNEPAYEAIDQELKDILNEDLVEIVQVHRDHPLKEETVQQLMTHQVLGPYVAGTALDQRKLAALTFDDGPHENTYAVLDLLDEHGIKATFFHIGAYVDAHPEITQEVVNRGHEIGNHSYGHPDFATMSDDEILNEINHTQESIEEVTGVLPTRYRMPFGSGGQRVIQLFPNLSSVMWNVDSQDWQTQNGDMIYRHTMDTMMPQSVMLFHETIPATVDALKRIIPELKEKGYEFVTLDEISYDYLNDSF